MKITIRDEQLEDIQHIEHLTKAAFLDAPHSSHTEHFIVNALRKNGQLTISLVALDGSAIVGHVAISPIRISSGDADWYGLGPISVMPDRQGQGIGSLLMNNALDKLKTMGAQGCVLLGEPNYYHRFGFECYPELILVGVPQAYFQALSFVEHIPQGEVQYDEAFNATQ